MRVLLSTHGSRGDVEPLAGLAVALQALGVETRVCAPPDAEFAALLDRAGTELAPAFMGVRDFIAMAKANPLPLPERATQVMAAQIEAISAAAEGCDAIVATGLLPSAAAAQCVAERKGLPYVYVALCPMYLPSADHAPFEYPMQPRPPGETDNRALWDHDIDTINAIFGAAVNGNRARIGLPTVDNVRDHVFSPRPLLASDPAVWPWRSEICDAVQTGAWILPDTRPLPADLETFLQAGDAPVYVGFGSLPTHDATAVARIGVEAARANGRRTILLRGWADLDRIDQGDDVFVVGEVNQQALFRRSAAIVHHGGAGTTTAAAAAGSPQVIVPQIVDQPFWAARIAALGIGVAHDGPIPTLETLTAALATALAPEVRRRATALSHRVRTDGAAKAAGIVLERTLAAK